LIVKLKRAYEPAEDGDGLRVLVDRLWARGVSKEALKLDAWMKELGPTAQLRKWFGHRPDRWDAFVENYGHELATPLRQLLLAELEGVAGKLAVTLVYGAQDAKRNEAVVLRDYLLHNKARSDDKPAVPDKLLVTVAALAAAHHDAVAPASAVKLLASTILTQHEIDGGLTELLKIGRLRHSLDGWRITPRGLKQVRQLSSTETETSGSS
jgi:uncharacterized protein YeaO (DUF488 family)